MWSIIIGVVLTVIYVILAVVGGLATQNTNAAMLVAMF
jgi:hypothetical protein